MRRSIDKECVLGLTGNGNTSTSLMLTTISIYGIIYILHKRFYYSNHCLALVMPENVYYMLAVVLSSVVWVIFVVVVDFVLPLYDPIGVNTSTCLSVVYVSILAMLDKRCVHEDKWQDLLVSRTSSVLLVNVQVHRQGT